MAFCAGKFPNGGHLYEPLSLANHAKVMFASREFVSEGSWFYIGINRGNSVGSYFKYVSSGITVPFEINWHDGVVSTDATQSCVYATNNNDLTWDDYYCNNNWYPICESTTSTTTTTTTPSSAGTVFCSY